jgi:tetratricopeptide (TPR) repeat protein
MLGSLLVQKLTLSFCRTQALTDLHRVQLFWSATVADQPRRSRYAAAGFQRCRAPRCIVCESFVNKFPARFLTTFTLRLTLPDMRNPRFLSFKKLGILCVLVALSFANLRAANSDVATNDINLPPPVSGSNEALRAYLQLQEQIHDTQLSIERNRLQAQVVAAQEGVALSNRLHAIEESLALQKTNDLIEAEHTSRMLMGVLAIFASVGLFAVLLMVYFQSRAVSRIAEVSTALASARGLQFRSTTALELAENEMLGNATVEQSNARLASLVQHLEKRIAELEQTAALPLKEVIVSASEPTPAKPEPRISAAPQESPSQVARLMERGQALLNSDRAEEALACFDEILAADSNNAEALVKKGTALEKLRQPQEALEYYDRAIAADSTLTIAYLHKGGLCSRLEKYGEAMECYELALHTQEKKQAA